MALDFKRKSGILLYERKNQTSKFKGKSMFNTTSYYQQSRGLPAENGFQHAILKWADTSTTLREVGKVGTVIGSVSTVASTFFGYDPTLSLSATAVSALTWLCCHELAQNLEPQAQSMLEHFRDLERERRNNPRDESNVVRLTPQEFMDVKEKITLALQASRLEKRKENSRSLAEELKKTLESKVGNDHSTQKLTQLFGVLLMDNIQKLNVNEDQIEICLYEKTKKLINSESTVLNLPQKIVFQIKDKTIVFDEKFAPYEDRTGSSFIKSNFAWWEIEIKGEILELIAPHNFGLFTTFAGGTPVVRRVNAQSFINSISN